MTGPENAPGNGSIESESPEPGKQTRILVRSGYKTEMKLNNKQQTACVRHAGTARFAYNWGLERRKEDYENTGKSSNAIELHRQLNALKKIEFPWMYDASKCAPQEALRDLDGAFENFFEGRAEYPKRKTKKRGVGSFRLTGKIEVFEKAIQLPRLGKLRLKERGYIPTDAHILSATVSERAGRWYVSVQVEEEIEVPENDGPVVGVDLGIKALAFVSDEDKPVENPRALERNLRKLKRQHREVSRRKKGGRNRKKSVDKLRKTYARIANIRADTLHKLTTRLAKTKSVIGIEDLNVSGMMKNRHLARAISDVGMGEFRRQLEYKTRWYGSAIVVADMFFPSSKKCSRCDHINEDLKLSDRVFVCDICGLTLDRDLNAARNLEKLAVSCTESVNACGRRERWPPRYSGGETASDEPGTERHIGDVLFG